MFKQKRKGGSGRRRIVLLALAGLCVFGALGVWVLFLTVEIPSIENFRERVVAESTRIYDRSGEILLWEIHGEERRTVIPFEEISNNIKNATIAIEDDSFYSHWGIRPLSIFRAFFVDVFQGKRHGGSTITQQLVKNTLLTPEQTFTRKIKEFVMAIKMESVYEKDEILGLYLNEIPYGSNAYGVESAAQNYFGKPARDITLAQSAYLAALPQAPTRYSPYGSRRQELEERKNLVLKRMLELEFITDDDYEKAKKEKVSFLPQKRGGLRAPHFVMYVRELLIEKYGEEVVEQGGLVVKTTLDAKLQETAEEIVARKGAEIETKFNASNAGLVAIDPKTGRILAMVGSRDYFNIEREGNFNITLAHRQPGSAFKPLVYAAAFKKGYTPETVVFDLETNFGVQGAEQYIPQNYDEKFRGPVTLRQALAQSLNVPSVKVLYLTGLDDALNTARDFGISELGDKSRYGLSLVLGGGEVTPLELTAAYGVFANQGLKTNAHAIISVEDSSGKVLEEERVNSERVIDSNIANLVTDILSDNEARTPTFGARSPLYIESYDVAVKTGTTNDYRDVWTVGYSPNLVVGAWAGNNNNSSMTKNVAGFIIAPLWREFMDAALPALEKEFFTKPQKVVAQKPVLRGIWRGGKTYVIDKTSGKLATDNTPESQREERIIQGVHSILYWLSKNDPAGPQPDRPETDSQFVFWENSVRAWAAQNGFVDDTSVPITDYDTTHSPENWPVISLPQDEQQKGFTAGQIIAFHPIITARYPVSEVEIFLDGEFVKSESGSVREIVLDVVEDGEHILKIRVFDSIGNRQEAEFSFTFSAG